MASGACAVTSCTPADLALVRMQSDRMKPPEERRNYKNVFDAMIRIIREEGGILSCWKGLSINVTRGMIMNTGHLVTYDESKNLFCNIFNHPNPDLPTLPISLGASIVSGLTVSVIGLPFDLVKSRI